MERSTPSAVWRLKHDVADLQLDRFSATVHLLRPGEGMVEVCAGANRFPNAHLLAVAIPSLTVGDAGSLIERYVCGADLVAAYKESPRRPIRVDARWRATTSNELMAAVELLVSVRTDALDSQAELSVQSHVSAGEVLRLLDANSGEYQPLAVSEKVPTTVQSAGGAGCLLFRLAGEELSYAEMVHPADFQADELLGRLGNDGTVCVNHRLFSERLEKGVILCARLRGMFLPREDDTRIVAESYAAFAAAEPPLSS